MADAWRSVVLSFTYKPHPGSELEFFNTGQPHRLRHLSLLRRGLSKAGSPPYQGEARLGFRAIGQNYGYQDGRGLKYDHQTTLTESSEGDNIAEIGAP